MATLIENKGRIINAFNSIRRAIINKGEIVEDVTTYADAILRIAPSSFVGRTLITKVSGNAQSADVPYTLSLPLYTADKDVNLLIYSGIYGTNPGSSSVHDALSIYINGTSVSCQQPVLLQDFHKSGASTWTSWFNTRVCYNKLSLAQGDTISADLVVNYVYPNDKVVAFIKLYDANVPE